MTSTDLERHSRLDLLIQDLSDALVEIGHDAHGELWLDAAAADQVVERVGESDTDACTTVQLVEALWLRCCHRE